VEAIILETYPIYFYSLRAIDSISKHSKTSPYCISLKFSNTIPPCKISGVLSVAQL
jgi:hypothetical protein